MIAIKLTVEFLSRITVTCFAASYLVVLAIEVSRMFFRVPVRWAIMFAFGIAGLFAHGVYIILQTNMNWGESSPLANWSAWCLVVAFLLVGVYLWLIYRQPNIQVGIFILPLSLVLIGIAVLMKETPGFESSNARTIWNSIHGGFLLLATFAMLLGFVMGLMYLFQSIRLKQKSLKSLRFKLPSLEWLHHSTERCLILSTVLMGLGVITGFVINRINRSNDLATVSFADPIVWSSLVMFGWCLAVSVVSRLYKPARSGRKMVYLTFSCFFFLVLELALVLTAGHGSEKPESPSIGWHHDVQQNRRLGDRP